MATGFVREPDQATPGNTTVRDLLSGDRYVGAVLEFLKTARVRETKEGAIRSD